MALLDSAGVPIVGGVDIVLVTIAVVNPSQAYWAALCAILGSVAGSLILFGIAHKGGEVLLERYISQGRGKRLHNWFERYGLVTVFVPAISPVPMPMKILVFCAGALEVRWSSFALVVLIARILRYTALAMLGQRFGTATFAYLKSHAVLLVVAIAVLAFLSIGLLRLLDISKAKSAGEANI
jgi:membrane protein YqaA with SNARE-associated domain